MFETSSVNGVISLKFSSVKTLFIVPQFAGVVDVTPTDEKSMFKAYGEWRL